MSLHFNVSDISKMRNLKYSTEIDRGNNHALWNPYLGFPLSLLIITESYRHENGDFPLSLLIVTENYRNENGGFPLGLLIVTENYRNENGDFPLSLLIVTENYRNENGKVS